MPALVPIPAAFTAKKTTILESLSVPDISYTDLSPKGTVDEAIRGLIDRINALEGVVTTSSCAGRISVFLEGRKHDAKRGSRMEDGEDREHECLEGESQAAVPGGKGMGGRWLFVSHEPVQVQDFDECTSRSLGLEPLKGAHWDVADKEPNQLRFARFQFEPMILHIMTASLHHAQPILTAAINAGFRESGVQSLKNLDDANSFPMVAIRSAGLALESVVGECDNLACEGDEIHSMVTEEYLEMLLKLANERFGSNAERTKRFEDGLFSGSDQHGLEWEDSEARKERKRAEGLVRQDALRQEAAAQQGKTDEDFGQENGTVFGALPLS